ncbi:MAG: DUF4132 domain-containing protein [Lewinella sp.]|nr:DUF4132 domain-containing protein [Lewinella sp.]
MDVVLSQFTFSPPENPRLAKIYEAFFKISPKTRDIEFKAHAGVQYATFLDDLKQVPSKAWFKEIEKLIDQIGHEQYREHVQYVMIHIIELLRRPVQFKAMRKRGLQEDEILLAQGGRAQYPQVLPPTEYYFYCSDKSRYLRGIILSVACIPDPLLLNLLERFVAVFPFQSAPISQAPTGLFTYDVFEVYSRLPLEQAIQRLMAVQHKLKAKYAQKKVAGMLDKLAKKNGYGPEEVMEIGLPDFGFDQTAQLQIEIGDYVMIYERSSWSRESTLWKDQQSGKAQKSIPKEIKTEHPERLTYLKNQLKEIKKQFDIQAKRVESYYWEDRTWTFPAWKNRYMDHHFMRLISRCLVWLFEIDGRFVPGVIKEDQIHLLPATDNFTSHQCTRVRLWHPVHAPLPDSPFIPVPEGQPFKQVARETYTDGFIKAQIGTKLSNKVLAMLYKSRGWSNTGTALKRQLKHQPLTLLLELDRANDGQYGPFTGYANSRLTGLTVLRAGKTIESSELDPVIYSELARDVDLFITKAKVE